MNLTIILKNIKTGRLCLVKLYFGSDINCRYISVTRKYSL